MRHTTEKSTERSRGEKCRCRFLEEKGLGISEVEQKKEKKWGGWARKLGKKNKGIWVRGVESHCFIFGIMDSLEQGK